jgi:hypothetical protein
MIEQNEQMKQLFGKNRYIFSEENIILKSENFLIFKGFDKLIKKDIIIERLDLKLLKDNSLNEILYKINLMKQIKSPFSIKILDIFQDENYYYFVMNLFDDTLENFKKKNGKLNIDLIKKIIFELNDVLDEMKFKKLLFKNLNINNILIKYNNKEQTDFDIKIINNINDMNLVKCEDEEEFELELKNIGNLLFLLINDKNPETNEKITFEDKNIENLINNLISKENNEKLNWEKDFNNNQFFIDYLYNKNYKNTFPNTNNENKYEFKIKRYKSHVNIIAKYFGQVLKDSNIKEGKGISYYNSGIILYEGDFKNDLPNGKGIEYYENKVKVYEGNYLDGKPDGFGIEFYNNGKKNMKEIGKMVNLLEKE